jgi:hypothetical protein
MLHHPKKKPTSLDPAPPPPPLTAADLLSVSMDLIILDISYDPNHAEFHVCKSGFLIQRPVILATQEAEIRSVVFRSQLGQIETLSRRKPSQKRGRGAGGVAQGVGPEFKPQYWEIKKKQQQN